MQIVFNWPRRWPDSIHFAPLPTEPHVEHAEGFCEDRADRSTSRWISTSRSLVAGGDAKGVLHRARVCIRRCALFRGSGYGTLRLV